MPAPYSTDLRWRAIWLVEFLDIDKAEASFYLGISKRTVERYIANFYRTADVVSLKVGRPYGCVEFHPHEELFIMEEILSRPDKMLSEIARDLCAETGSEFSLSAIQTYLTRNDITTKKLRRIALQRSEEARVQFRAVSCLFQEEMFVFLDESGFDKRILRNYGHSFKGTRAEVGRLRQPWGTRVTAIPVVCTDGILDVGLYGKSVTNQN